MTRLKAEHSSSLSENHGISDVERCALIPFLLTACLYCVCLSKTLIKLLIWVNIREYKWIKLPETTATWCSAGIRYLFAEDFLMMQGFFAVVVVPGFERGKEDLLPLPLKEDSNSISKSKVRKKTYCPNLRDVLGWLGKNDWVLPCWNETNPY